MRPYDPDEHRVRPLDPPGWRDFLLVITIFVFLPLAACAVVEGAARVNLPLVILGFVGFGLGLYYGIRNVDALEDEDEV